MTTTQPTARLTLRPRAWVRDGRAAADRLVACGLVLAASCSRFTVDVGPVAVRPEHLAALLLAVVVVANPGWRARLWTVVRRPTSLTLLSFVAWLAAVSAVRSPDLTASARIVGWLGLDAMVFIAMATLPRAHAAAAGVLRWGTRCAFVLAVLGIGLWVSASTGGPVLGVQLDGNYGGYAVYATTYEANIFASVVVLWALAYAATGQRGRAWVEAAVAIVVPVALVASHTRAAFAALALGLLLLMCQPSARPRAMNIGGVSVAVLATVLQGPAVGVVVGVGVAAVLVVSYRWWLRPGSARTERPGRRRGRRHRFARTWLAGGVGLALVAAGLVVAGVLQPADLPGGGPTGLSGKFSQGDLGSGTGKVRFDQWTTALGDLHGRSLLTGLGANTYGERHLDPTQPGRPGYLSNMWLSVVYEGGLIGLALLVAFGGLLVWSLPARWRAAAIALGAAFAVLNVFTSSIWFMTTWLLAALGASVARSGRTRRP